jgi:hypothetical protein
VSATKIFIGGGPAGGKTTLSRRLAAKLNVPVYEMDGLLMSSLDGGDPFEAVSNKVVAQITARDTWIVESAYFDWMEPLLLEADLVVWMDVPCGSPPTKSSLATSEQQSQGQTAFPAGEACTGSGAGAADTIEVAIRPASTRWASLRTEPPPSNIWAPTNSRCSPSAP